MRLSCYELHGSLSPRRRGAGRRGLGKWQRESACGTPVASCEQPQPLGVTQAGVSTLVRPVCEGGPLFGIWSRWAGETLNLLRVEPNNNERERLVTTIRTRSFTVTGHRAGMPVCRKVQIVYVSVKALDQKSRLITIKVLNQRDSYSGYINSFWTKVLNYNYSFWLKSRFIEYKITISSSCSPKLVCITLYICWCNWSCKIEHWVLVSMIHVGTYVPQTNALLRYLNKAFVDVPQQSVCWGTLGF